MPLSKMERIALVTGASSGIGRAIALGLADDGFGVVCCDLVREPRKDGFEIDKSPTDEAIAKAGGRSKYVRLDVAREKEVRRAFSASISAFGHLDVVVNNAGIAQSYAPIQKGTVNEFRQVMAVNVDGMWLCCREAVRAFKAQESAGSIVNVASIAAIIGLPEEVAYSASKGAVLGLTRALALEVAALGIMVNAVCPGFVETGMARLDQADAERWRRLNESTPTGRLGKPGDVANLVRFLASGQTWLTGSALIIDGGFTTR